MPGCFGTSTGRKVSTADTRMAGDESTAPVPSIRIAGTYEAVSMQVGTLRVTLNSGSLGHGMTLLDPWTRRTIRSVCWPDSQQADDARMAGFGPENQCNPSELLYSQFYRLDLLIWAWLGSYLNRIWVVTADGLRYIKRVIYGWVKAR